VKAKGSHGPADDGHALFHRAALHIVSFPTSASSVRATMPKKSFPLARVYTLIEPGPVVLLTTAAAGRSNVMAMSWQSMLEFEPPLIGCVISDRNHSYGLLKASRQCAINIPESDIAGKVVSCGNTTGAKTDKFKRFGLTPHPATVVDAPLIEECFASLECRVVDTSMARKYCIFVLEVLQAWADPRVKHPRTIHHRGYGSFMIAGETIRLRSGMR